MFKYLFEIRDKNDNYHGNYEVVSDSLRKAITFANDYFYYLLGLHDLTFILLDVNKI